MAARSPLQELEGLLNRMHRLLQMACEGDTELAGMCFEGCMSRGYIVQAFCLVEEAVDAIVCAGLPALNTQAFNTWKNVVRALFVDAQPARERLVLGRELDNHLAEAEECANIEVKMIQKARLRPAFKHFYFRVFRRAFAPGQRGAKRDRAEYGRPGRQQRGSGALERFFTCKVADRLFHIPQLGVFSV